MKNENTLSIADATGVSEWWFTRNIIAALFGIAASLSLGFALDLGTEKQPSAAPRVQPVTIATR